MHQIRPVSPRACGSGRTSFTSGSALGLCTSTMTKCWLDPGEEGAGLSGQGGRGGGGGGPGGAGTLGAGGGIGDEDWTAGFTLLGDWTRGNGPIGCWLTFESWGAGTSILRVSGGDVWGLGAFGCLGSLVWEREGAVKYKPDWDELEEGRLLSVAFRPGRRWSPGGGGGLKEGGESEVEWTSS